MCAKLLLVDDYENGRVQMSNVLSSPFENAFSDNTVIDSSFGVFHVFGSTENEWTNVAFFRKRRTPKMEHARTESVNRTGKFFR